MRSSSAPRVVSFRPVATTVTSVTSATPIVSASAVVIVRPGWRIALRRASPPAAPPTACAGRPSSDASARTARAGSRTPADLGRRRAQRLDRRDARRPPGRQQAGGERHERADEQRDDDRARGEHGARLGQREAHRVEQRVERRARARSRRARPTSDASGADRERLDQHRAEHLAAVRADHPQQPELTRALGDGDRERVEDRERADEDRDAAEHEQRDPDDRDELLQPVEREAVLLRGGDDLRLRQRVGQVGRAARRRGRRRSPPTRIPSYRSPAVEQLLRGAQVEHGRRRGAERLDAAEARDADDLELVLLAARRRSARSSRCRSPGPRRWRRRCTTSPGPAAQRPSSSRNGVSRSAPGVSGVEADAEVRAVAGGLAVALDDLGLVGDVAGGDRRRPGRRGPARAGSRRRSAAWRSSRRRRPRTRSGR